MIEEEEGVQSAAQKVQSIQAAPHKKGGKNTFDFNLLQENINNGNEEAIIQ